jgi:hypothetical protein
MTGIPPLILKRPVSISALAQYVFNLSVGFLFLSRLLHKILSLIIIHAGIHAVQGFVVENIDRKSSLTGLPEIANKIGLQSEKQLARILKSKEV